MPAQIRPSRLAVTDRFPVLSFLIRSSKPGRAEIALATDPALFEPGARERRTAETFFASGAAGELAVPRGEAVWTVPADVLLRFAGQPRLYFTLAFAPDGEGRFAVAAPGGADRPYVSLADLTGRSLRGLRLMPSRQARKGGGLSWAGDAAEPSAQPAPASPASDAPAYDDGFGPLEDARGPEPVAAPPPAEAPPSPTPAAAQALGPVALALSLGSERVPVSPPPVTALTGSARLAAETALLALSGPMLPFVLALRGAARLSAAAGAPVTIGLGRAVGGGLGAGASLGAGIVFGPNGELGVYGAAQFNVGFLTSISATAQVTVVRGGLESFGGWSLAATVSGGEGVVGGASALFDMHGNFAGVTAEAGVGVGFSPVDFYVAVQRQVAHAFGMAAALGALGSEAEAMGAGGPRVEIRYRAFIPSPAVAGPFDLLGGRAFGGDDRGFDPAFGTSRGEITAQVFLTAGGGVERIEMTDARWHPTTAYASSDVEPVAGKPDWWRARKPGARPVETATLARTPANLDVVRGASGTARNVEAIAERASLVSVRAAGANPLVALAPTIDADLAVFLRVAGETLEAKVVGTHDGFPAHELYVNGVRLVAHDPVAAGSSPWDLADLRGVEVRTGWTPVGRVAASLGLAAPAEAFAGDIPLDPGAGGMSIGYDALRVGDIILSTTDAAISRAIRAATSGAVSHAMLYVGQGGQVIEAVGDGVRLVPLDRALQDATVAVAFRAPGLDDVARQRVAEEAARLLDRPYDRIGIARQALFQIDRRLCAALPNGLAERCRRFAGRIDLGTSGNDSFFCSELVLEAYARAGHPLTLEPPHWATPEDIAELRFDYGRLRYVGHLKAAPSGGLFGHLLAHAADAPVVEDEGPTSAGHALGAEAPAAEPAPAAALAEEGPAPDPEPEPGGETEVAAPPAPPAASGLAAAEPGPRHRVTREVNGVTFDLEQYAGMRSPEPAPAVMSDPLAAEVLIEDWPRLPGDAGEVVAGVRIGWRHAGGAVGDIEVSPTDAATADGWSVSVRGRIADGPDAPGVAAATVALAWRFARGDEERRATVTVIVRGDGRWARENAWADAPEPVEA
ncbi:YiiX/YebB-like N1pC/P60 family cysteine hydrolase [Thermaurantiacus tibetensis]|uniref:YiiX/YebB-like N1pC/P60 family cysteine hydrolase n=1 Tax=Thermaurantiacus tibetensis TaxID=2759035 RepID=UPI00188F9D70|nr:YiiX/YebB-like N1pC/P60 family cysteine hydrolase [Thermaurantiacus tibetensis]